MNPWIGLAAFILTYDVWLIATGRRSLTEVYQTNPAFASAATVLSACTFVETTA